jgi:hypothetical protein
MEGRCLLGIIRPSELCNPVDLSIPEAPRETAADGIDELAATSQDSLLCYGVRLASKLTDANAASLIGASTGDRVSRQSKHVAHSVRNGNPVSTAPAAGFPAPLLMDTKVQSMLCLPSFVTDTAPVE